MYAELNAVWQDGLLDIDAVPTTTARVLDLPAGTDADIGVTLIDSLGNFVDLDIAGVDKLELIVQQFMGVKLFSKLATKLNTTGAYKFALANTDTRDYRGKLIFEVWATKAGVKRRVVAPGHMQLGLGVAQ